MKQICRLGIIAWCAVWAGVFAALAGQGDGLVAAEGLSGARIPADARLRVMADRGRQGVEWPTALAWDSRGGLWIAESPQQRTDEDAAGVPKVGAAEDLALSTPEERSALLRKRVHAVGSAGARVRVLSDANADGVYEESRVYAGDLERGAGEDPAGGLLESDGRVYVACGSKLWKLLDKDGDGAADERGVMVGGFGVRVSWPGHGMGRLVFGPDGRLWGVTGDQGMAVGAGGMGGSFAPGQGLVFRCELDGSRFEVVHRGLRNPRGVAFGENGDVFTVDGAMGQGDKARLVRVMEGGDSGWEQENGVLAWSHRELGLEERPRNRWLAERMWEPANEEQPGYLLPPVANLEFEPGVLAAHPGSGFPEAERGRFLLTGRGGADGAGIWSLALEPEGAGVRMAGLRRFADGVVADDLGFAPEGRLVLADAAGNRLWALEPRSGAAGREAVAALLAAGFAELPSVELLELLDHPDMRVRVRAQLALAAKPGAVGQFEAGLRSDRRLRRLHAVWGLGMLARGWQPLAGMESGFGKVPDKKTAAAALGALAAVGEHPDAETRAQVLRVVGEAGVLPAALRLEILLDDKSPRVRMFGLIAAGRLKVIGALGKAIETLEREGGKDPWLRHAAIQALARIAMPEQTLALLGHPDAEVRRAAVVALRQARDARLAAFLADEDARVVDEAVRAIHDLALEDGRAGVAALLDDYYPGKSAPARSVMTMRRMLVSAFRLGGDENARRLLAVAGCGRVEEEIRVEAVRLLGWWENPPPVDRVTGHWRPLPQRDAASVKRILLRGTGSLLESRGALLQAVLEMVGRLRLGSAAIGTPALRGLVENEAVGGAARAEALRLLVEREDGAVSRDALVKWAGDAADEVAMQALRCMAPRDPTGAAALLREATIHASPGRSLEAWRILASMPDPAAAAAIVEGLQKVAKGGVAAPVADGIMEAAAMRREPAVIEALELGRRVRSAARAPAGGTVSNEALAGVVLLLEQSRAKLAPGPRWILPVWAWLLLGLWFAIRLRAALRRVR